MRNLVLSLCSIFIFYNSASSQKWHDYSDSVFFYFKLNNNTKALEFISLADSELKSESNLESDTIFADYLYRKGVVESTMGDFSSNCFRKSLNIWELSLIKNYFKIMKIDYFIGGDYFQKWNKSQNSTYADSGYLYYKMCYNLIKKYNYQSYNGYKTLLSMMSSYDYKNSRYEESKKIASEYFDYVQKIGIEDFDFNFTDCLKNKQDTLGQEKKLLEYLDKYNLRKLNNPGLLFKIYMGLLGNKMMYSLVGSQIKSQKYPKEIIKYGEKAYDIYIKNALNFPLELSIITSELRIAYNTIGDNINEEKYRKIHQESINPKNDDDTYYNELEHLYKIEDYNNFRLKFEKYYTLLLNENKYDKLLEIMPFSITLYVRNIVFKKEEVASQLQIINNNRNTLSVGDKTELDRLRANFFFYTNQIDSSLKICENYLDNSDKSIKLCFSDIKASCESLLGNNKEATIAYYKSFEIAKSFYKENDSRLIQYYTSVIGLENENSKTEKFATEALKILYTNKLEETETGCDVWLTLGTKSMNQSNFQDAFYYLNKSRKILESTKAINNPYYYYSTLLGLSQVELFTNKTDSAKIYLDIVKAYLDSNSNMMQIAYCDYYFSLGNYFFQRDSFYLAKTNYEKSLSLCGNRFSKLHPLNRYILSKYFIENNAQQTIKELQDYLKYDSSTSLPVNNTIYFLKFNLGDNKSAKQILLDNLKRVVAKNNEYFHLLSDDEKAITSRDFSVLFECLNSYLLQKDPSFIAEYMGYRFYFKSLLLNNRFSSRYINPEDSTFYNERKKNSIEIDKNIEKKSNDIELVNRLKSRNRELEKILLQNSKPLSTVTLEKLKVKLKVKDAYVEIIRINKQARNNPQKGIALIKYLTDSIYYGAVIIKKYEEPKFILIDSTDNLEKTFVADFQRSLTKREIDSVSYHLLFEKIEKELSGINKIYFVADGAYNAINIESIYNPEKKKYLIDYLKIQPIENVRSIIDKESSYRISSETKAVFFGNPAFDILHASTNKNVDLMYETHRNTDSIMFSEIKSSIKLTPLEGTEKEILNISSLLKDSKSSVSVYSKAEATEDNLKKIQSPDILHIATHGYFLKGDETSKTKMKLLSLIDGHYKNDSYLKSGLLFSGAQNTLNGHGNFIQNNGILTAEEAKSLELNNTELVVLSACETGLGDYQVGEGVIGLQRAFMIAGAKSVIMSLWNVGDELTQRLMTQFYTNWTKGNMSKEDAFYKAKLEIKRAYPEPYYWAAFKLLE